MRSLRARLAVATLSVIGALLVVGAVALRLSVARSLTREVDRTLEAQALALIGVTEQKSGAVELDFDVAVMPAFGGGHDPEYFELWVDGREVASRSPTLGAGDLPRLTSFSPATRVGARHHGDLELPDGRVGRATQIAFVPTLETDDDENAVVPPPVARAAALAFDAILSDDDEAIAEEDEEEDHSGEIEDDDAGEDEDEDEEGDVDVESPTLEDVTAAGLHHATLVVARSRESLDRQLTSLDLALGVFLLAVLAALGLLVPLALGVGLRPLGEMVDQVGALDSRHLDHRIAVPSLPSELTPLVDRLNELLERLQRAFDRERRFSSNVAHELRTPLAELRALAEVGGKWPEDESTVAAFFGDVEQVGRKMERIVTHLISLARYEGGLETVVPSRVDLADAFEQTWKPLAPLAEQRGIELTRSVAPGLVVDTDAEKLAMILGNLLANAVQHSPAGSTISCYAEREAASATARIEIANPTAGLERGDVELMFDRFWRKDEARTAGEHLGLGLSLVRAFSELLTLELEATLDEEGVFRVTLKIPLAD